MFIVEEKFSFLKFASQFDTIKEALNDFCEKCSESGAPAIEVTNGETGELLAYRTVDDDATAGLTVTTWFAP